MVGLSLCLALFLQSNPVAGDGVIEELARSYGKTIPISTTEGIGEVLWMAGLVKTGQTEVEVTDKLVRDVVAVRSFFAPAQYRVGERIFVKDAGGKLSYRAEIRKVNADGTYEVEVWDKLKSVSYPDFGPDDWRRRINPETGELSNPGMTTVEMPDGRNAQFERPWLERPNARTIRMEHAEIAAINNPADVAWKARYDVFGYIIDPYGVENGQPYDPVLRARLDQAMKKVDKLVASGELDLRLPADPVERAKQLDRITEAQRDLIREIWAQNPMSYLRGDNATAKWNAAMADPTLKDAGGRHKIGAQLKAAVGVCSDQTAGMTSVLREVGRRAGFDVKPLNGATLDGGGHAFMVIRLANGQRHIMDPSWHAVSSFTSDIALESIDFATFDKRWWSNRDINSFSEPSRRTEFVKPGAAEDAARRGFTEAQDAVFKAATGTSLLDATGRLDRARVGSTVRREAVGAGQFAAAYLLKEAMNGRLAVSELAQPKFWTDLAVFSVAARAAEHLPLRGLAKSAVPLALGMAAVQFVSGHFSARDVAIDTASFLAAGAAVSLIADGLVYPVLFAAGPPGWIAAGVYSIAKLAVTLYAGEKLGAWLRGLFPTGDRRLEARDSVREGVKQKLDAVAP